MNKREKTLAILVVALLVGAVLIVGGKKVYKTFTTRTKEIAKLKEEVKLKNHQVRKGQKARGTLDLYMARALVNDVNLAGSAYRAWLTDWVEAVGVYDLTVSTTKETPIQVNKEQVHTVLEFSVNCNTTLPQLVELLYEFYSQDYLHRIKSLTVTPAKGNLLLLSFSIEVISMPGATERELEDLPSERLALGSLEEYQEVIVQRNPYSPANKPPQFVSGETQSGYVDERMSFSPAVEDPEEGQITYRVEHDGLEGLSIDPRSGRIDWTPQETGEFEVLVYAMDDGIPAKESQQTIHLAVREPPPEEEARPAPPPPPSFDEAKYTFVTGIVEVNGRRQVWLTVRTEGKMLRLFEGDEFLVGRLQGRVVRIHPREVEISTGETVVAVRFGDSLYEGEVLRDSGDVAARDRD